MIIKSITTGEVVICDHGSIKKKCEVCERDERIKELECEVEKLEVEKHKAFERVQELTTKLNNFQLKLDKVLEYIEVVRFDIRLSDNDFKEVIDAVYSMLKR